MPAATSSGMAPPVAPVTPREYQPVRVLMSVLLRPQAATLINASRGPGTGTGQSSCHSS